MTLRIPLSSSAQRTHPPSISHLMQTALENPEIVSLAAGSVDKRSLPVPIAARAIGIPIDEQGLRLDELEATLGRLEDSGQLERVKLIYTIPEHANPTGISLSADRRGPLVELARRWSKTHRIFVLEDAAYRGLTFGAREPPSLWSHDCEGDTVILARTFSKTFSPGLKVGYGVLPQGLIDPILHLKGNHDF